MLGRGRLSLKGGSLSAGAFVGSTSPESSSGRPDGTKVRLLASLGRVVIRRCIKGSVLTPSAGGPPKWNNQPLLVTIQHWPAAGQTMCSAKPFGLISSDGPGSSTIGPRLPPGLPRLTAAPLAPPPPSQAVSVPGSAPTAPIASDGENT